MSLQFGIAADMPVQANLILQSEGLVCLNHICNLTLTASFVLPSQTCINLSSETSGILQNTVL